MSRENLREAIKDWHLSSQQLSELHGFERSAEKLQRVLAAARAYACERCGGKGVVWLDKNGEIVKGLSDYFMQCPDCAEWRRTADGGEPS